jgi:hypothetical protein
MNETSEFQFLIISLILLLSLSVQIYTLERDALPDNGVPQSVLVETATRKIVNFVISQ